MPRAFRIAPRRCSIVDDISRLSYYWCWYISTDTVELIIRAAFISEHRQAKFHFYDRVYTLADCDYRPAASQRAARIWLRRHATWLVSLRTVVKYPWHWLDETGFAGVIAAASVYSPPPMSPIISLMARIIDLLDGQYEIRYRVLHYWFRRIRLDSFQLRIKYYFASALDWAPLFSHFIAETERHFDYFITFAGD